MRHVSVDPARDIKRQAGEQNLPGIKIWGANWAVKIRIEKGIGNNPLYFITFPIMHWDFTLCMHHPFDAKCSCVCVCVWREETEMSKMRKITLNALSLMLVSLNCAVICQDVYKVVSYIKNKAQQ